MIATPEQRKVFEKHLAESLQDPEFRRKWELAVSRYPDFRRRYEAIYLLGWEDATAAQHRLN